MTPNTVRTRIDEQIKKKALPFEPLTPNAQTIEAMKEARQKKLPSFDNVDALMMDLNADD